MKAMETLKVLFENKYSVAGNGLEEIKSGELRSF
jgi:hypothetical protein